MPKKSVVKKSAKSKTSGPWWKLLDPTEVNEAMEESIIDCHDESEQHSGLMNLIQDELQCPFPARVMGLAVTVVDTAWPDADPYGLDFVCEFNGQKYPIAASSVEIDSPLPEGHQFVAALFKWRSHMG